MPHLFHSIVVAINAVLVLLGFINAMLVLHYEGSYLPLIVPALAFANILAIAPVIRK